MNDRKSTAPQSPAAKTPVRPKHLLHAFSISVLVGVQLAACAAGFLYATAHVIGLPELVLDAVVGLCLLASLALTGVLFIRTVRVEQAIERGEDAALVTWNPRGA